MPASDYIWRLEGPTGTGPYNQFTSRAQFLTVAQAGVGDYWSHEKQPVPPYDGMGLHDLTLAGTPIFGFCELAQARSWWSEPADGPLFERHGIDLVAYLRADVEDREIGGHQVAFVTHAKPVARLPLHRLWTDDDETLAASVDALRHPFIPGSPADDASTRLLHA